MSGRMTLAVAFALLSCERDGAGPPSGPPAGARPDPTLLPVASKQAPETAAYSALAVATQPAGFSYNDPVTGVKVWKVTSSSVPAPNTGAGQPDRDLCFSFSNLATQPRIAYVVHNGVLNRFNSETMQIENTGNFPSNVSAFAWLQHDRNDVWFAGLVDATTAFAWNSQTNQYLTHSETWLDEGRLV